MLLSKETKKKLTILHNGISDDMLEVIALCTAITDIGQNNRVLCGVTRIAKNYARRIFNKMIECREILEV